MRSPARLLVAAAALALAAPVAASANPTAPQLRSQDVFFHCHGSTKVANASTLQTGRVTGWDDKEPTASLTTGAGCGWADPGATRHTSYEAAYGDAAFSGTFTGNLSSLTVKVHNVFVGPARTGAPATFRVSLRVDGEEVFAPDSTAPGRASVTVTPTISSTGLSGEYALTVTDLPYVTEEGPGSQERRVDLVVGATENVNAWVYDTTEVPSGIEFNPAVPAKATVKAG